jgi:anti-anti-sigma factor
MEFRLEERDGRFYASGELDFDTASIVQRELLDARPKDAVLDLADVEFIDSSGLSALLVASEELEGFSVVNPSPAVRRMLELTGTWSVLVRAEG